MTIKIRGFSLQDSRNSKEEVLRFLRKPNSKSLLAIFKDKCILELSKSWNSDTFLNWKKPEKYLKMHLTRRIR
jgi:hypothetical protein